MIIFALSAVILLGAGIMIGITLQKNSTKSHKADGEAITFSDNDTDGAGSKSGSQEGDRGEGSIGEEGEESRDPEADVKTDTAEDAVSRDGYILDYVSNNSWQDGSITMYGVEFMIRNASGKPVEGWELEIGVKGLVRAEGWNGSFKVDGDRLIIKNAEYNGIISDGSGVDPGCNLGVDNGEFKISYAKLNGEECSVREVAAIDRDAIQNGTNNGTDNQANNNAGIETTDVSELLKRSDRAKQGDDWLHTDGNRILDSRGNEVWLTGLNWFGYNTGTNTFDGLSNSRLEPMVKSIADRGFNLIRVPISAQLLNDWAVGNYPKANYNNAYNPELNAMNSLEIFDYFLKLAEDNGIKVMIDIHSAQTDAGGHNANLWYTDKVSADEYLKALKWAANRYRDNDTIIAFDLKNEPHGKPEEGNKAAVWNDSRSENNWKYMAERAALTVLNENPEVLVFVEGVEAYPIDIRNNSDYHSRDGSDYYFNWWGGNLRGVRDYPVVLGKYSNKLVYSPHDYGPTVYAQEWFKGDFDYDSLMKDCWDDNWFFIYREKIAPLHIGEWGGFMRDPNLKWMTCMRQLIKKYHLNHTFWCLNPNSGDTGGLLLDDFNTWDEEKYSFVREVLWQKNGKFQGLDHAIPLGENGLSL